MGLSGKAAKAAYLTWRRPSVVAPSTISRTNVATPITPHPGALPCHYPNVPFRAPYTTAVTTTSTISSSSNTVDLIDELDKRGLIQTITSRSLRSHLASSSRTVYSGVDPSAPSLHVGNLLPLFTLVHFARCGHKPIVLVGGATGSIGDPSGRSTERNALDKITLDANVQGIKTQLKAFFENVQEYYHHHRHQYPRSQDVSFPLPPQQQTEFESLSEPAKRDGEVELGMGVKLMNNYTWTAGVTLLDFLGSVGRHARLTHMLARDSVASRLNLSTSLSSSSSSFSSSSSSSSSSSTKGGGGMSYTEFSYQLLQAFDFSYLHRTHCCTIQIGGSDQLGNITAGIDLIRRTSGLTISEPAFGLTLPLLTTSKGEKFGKSAGNAVWLDQSKTSDLEFYQFFLKTNDNDVQRYLNALTLLSGQEVEEVMKQHTEGGKEKKERRIAQTVLADHITSLIRGKKNVEKCKALTDILFSHTTTTTCTATVQGEQMVKNALERLDLSSITKEDNIVTELKKDQVMGQDITKLVVNAGLVKSRAEAKRLLASGGLYINNKQVSKDGGVGLMLVNETDLVQVKGQGESGRGRGAVCLLRAGKGAVKVIHVT
ncbi:related to tyrosyl-tRNA synthetase, mitochondrial precursor [Melanopsichium pennsylvanicum]|uniref:tyrosine--tRNA ligase n=1 Tax=Melanopsichium pennsylvanicum TaxID=63383 RepID=A0AAJ4XMZ5_9BASI|nr:related to tyrosyl-tRNA synthetase, mitochondrial precursor [Melanopsichium pennsylvanicum]